MGMTRDEALKVWLPIIQMGVEAMPECKEALDMAIKALEQEPILDKLEAEIDKIYEREGNSVDCLNALDELKWFIDRCKAENEDKE